MEIIIIASAVFGIMIGWVLGYSIKKAEVKDTKNLVDNLNKLTNKITEVEKKLTETKKELTETKKERDYEKSMNIHWFNEYERVREKHYKEMSKLRQQTNFFAADGIDKFVEMRNLKNKCSEAVKYAMKMSHPDNNGNAEDFMKFRKLYKEITG